jgi:hypothetical protein
MPSNANFRILEITDEFVFIEDVGPWYRHKTITNDAENVVETLYLKGKLKNNKKLYYVDSDNDIGELQHKCGTFLGFSQIKENIRKTLEYCFYK